MQIMAINTKKIAQNHSIVTLVSEKYEGSRTIRKEEMKSLLPGVKTDDINTKVVSVGTKKLYNPKLLNHGEKLKTRASALLEKHGVKHTGRRGLNYIVANAMLDTLLDELEIIQSEYHNWVNFQFSDTQYKNDLQEWADENPDLRELIMAASPSAAQARGRFSFEILLEDISASDDSAQSERVREAKEKTSATLVGSLGDRLISEVSTMANQTLEKSIDGVERLTRRVLSPAKNISNKLRSLSMLTPLAAPLAAHIDSQIKIGEEGGSKPLTSAQVATIVALYQMLSNPAQISDFMIKTGKLEGGEETEEQTETQESLRELLQERVEGADYLSTEPTHTEEDVDLESEANEPENEATQEIEIVTATPEIEVNVEVNDATVTADIEPKVEIAPAPAGQLNLGGLLG